MDNYEERIQSLEQQVKELSAFKTTIVSHLLALESHVYHEDNQLSLAKFFSQVQGQRDSISRQEFIDLGEIVVQIV